MKKNALMMASYQILALIFPLITTPYISRVLGSEGVGIYSYTYARIAFFSMFAMLGVAMYGQREIARAGADIQLRSQTFFEIYLIQFCASLATFLVYYFGVFFVFEQKYRDTYLLQGIYLISSLLDISWFYFGIEKFGKIILRNLFVKVLSFSAILLFVKEPNDYNLYTLIMSASYMLSQFVIWIDLRKEIIFKRISFTGIKRHIIPVFKLFVPALSSRLFFVVDRTVLGLFMTVRNVGFYENAYKIVSPPLSAVSAISTSMLPKMSSLFVLGKEDESLAYINKSLTVIVCFSAPVALGLFAVADNFVPWFLGDQFLPSVPLLKILALYLIASSWGSVFRNQIVIPKGYDNLYLQSILFAVVLNIFLNVILIQLIGAAGAAWSCVATEWFICLYQHIRLNKEFPFWPYLKANIHYYICAGIMMTAVLLAKDWGGTYFTSMVLQIVIGVFIYIPLVIAMEAVLHRPVITTMVKESVKKIRRQLLKNRL